VDGIAGDGIEYRAAKSARTRRRIESGLLSDELQGRNSGEAESRRRRSDGSLGAGGFAWLIRVESTAGEMRIGPREFAGGFHGELGSKTPMAASWFPQFPCWVTGSERRQKYLQPVEIDEVISSGGEGARVGLRLRRWTQI